MTESESLTTLGIQKLIGNKGYGSLQYFGALGSMFRDTKFKLI